jgi:hypothetical protein
VRHITYECPTYVYIYENTTTAPKAKKSEELLLSQSIYAATPHNATFTSNAKRWKKPKAEEVMEEGKGPKGVKRRAPLEPSKES